MKLGVDVGLQGAIAILNDDLSLEDVFDMPIMPLKKGKNQVNASALATILRIDKQPAIAYVEAVSAMPNQGVSSMFSFGTSYGIVQGVLAALGIPIVLITPQSWKKKAGLLGKDKQMARTLAQRLYPNADLSRKKDIGRADAILIARYGCDK